jgi:chemotaxis protein CheZ
MPVRRKVFRIEALLDGRDDRAADTPAPVELLAEVAALRAMLERGAARPPAEAGNADRHAGNGFEDERLRQLKAETDSIQRAITRTKQEIAALHVHAVDAPDSGRAARELDAVLGGTERATQQILAAAEDIDEAANTLSAALKNEQAQALAQDIRDQVIRIFEACNFQDLTGQRIGKVLATLKFVEERIARMMDIWGGIDAFRDYTAAALAERRQQPEPLDGPRLDGDPGHVTQAQIDAMFETGIRDQRSGIRGQS